jgi:hypothetical protein
VKVDTRLTVNREVHACWINEIFAYLKEKQDDIRKGLEKLGITDACRTDFTVDDNPVHLQIFFPFKSLTIRISSHLYH